MKRRVLLLLLCLSIFLSSVSCDASDDSSLGEELSMDSSYVSEENEISKETTSEDKYMAYTVDKSGYLKDKQTNNLNFNSITIKAKDFKGEFKNCHLDENGRLTIDVKENLNHSTFESEVINVGAFKTMLISWNAMCGKGKTEVLVSFETTDGKWSDYFSYGTWSDKELSSTSKSVKNEFGKMNVDTLVPAKATTGNIKFRINISKFGKYYPVVENITIATSEMKTATPSKYPSQYNNPVPMRSQHAPENGPDGNVMCSATTVAMALEYLGEKITTVEAGKGTWDKEFQGYGNWLFAVATASSYGYYAFCDFYDEDMIKYALSKGYSIGCSTYLTDSGHIVLVVGYEVVDGVEYYIVNDPNVKSASPAVTKYTCEYFNSVWLKKEYNNQGVVYVFQGQY